MRTNKPQSECGRYNQPNIPWLWGLRYYGIRYRVTVGIQNDKRLIKTRSSASFERRTGRGKTGRGDFRARGTLVDIERYRERDTENKVVQAGDACVAIIVADIVALPILVPGGLLERAFPCSSGDHDLLRDRNID